jgi:hypothetical protein
MLKNISTLPKQSKVIAWLKMLPVSLQVLIILLLLFLTWHFRYYETGKNEAELTKIEGVLYAMDCIEKTTGEDRIVLHTSLQNEIVVFGSWQKCKYLAEAIHLLREPQQVRFYIQKHVDILNPESQGALWIYAIDLLSTNKPLIYPFNGLGVQYSPNPFCLIFFFIAFALIESLRERWLEEKARKSRL